jgi:hypothetical protein
MPQVPIKNLTVADVPMASVKMMDVPAFMPAVVAEVANGGSLLDLVARMGVPYEHATRWIYTDKARQAVYEGALATRAEWFVQGIMRELKALCFVDIKDAFDDNTGRLKSLADIPENIRRNIAGIEVLEQWDEDGNKTGELKKIKLTDKRGSLELLMKHLKMFVEEKRVVVSGEVKHTVEGFDLEDRIAQLRRPKIIEAVTVIDKPGSDI